MFFFFFANMLGLLHLKIKKGETITKVFQKILNESFWKPSEIWVDKGTEFHKKLMKPWLQDKYIKAYSTHNEGKSVVAEQFVRTVKDKIYKYITATSKIMYNDKVSELVNQYSNTIQSK